MIEDIKEEFQKLKNPEHAVQLQRYFKTGKGEYGEGDIFLGLRVPVIRKTASKYKTISLEIAVKFLHSPFHEERLFALLVMIEMLKKANGIDKEKIYNLYLNNTEYINNWDLVDLSAGKIIGSYLFDRSREPLYLLAKSKYIWERRIAIISTSYFISKNDFEDTLNIAEVLLQDKEDLIQKAVGWMLREVGKRDLETEERFLKIHYKLMPRTMLRYAIERFPDAKRQIYLKK
ncbi:MAG: DNA alkylation repair protein [Atribacterota bacterium]|nr:DNA alkylation repair protein [Atribacterota bacterium]